MDIFDMVSEQIDTVGLPLFAVSVSVVTGLNTPALAILHWHGFRRTTPLALPGVKIPHRPVPASAIELHRPWREFEAMEASLIDAAWQLGAWELERIERRPCSTIGASAREALACRQAFGDYADGGANEHLVDEGANRDGLMHMAADKGYVRWLFRPVKGGLWRELREPDDSLQKDGGRRPPCPVRPLPRSGAGARTVYRLGRIDRILLP